MSSSDINKDGRCGPTVQPNDLTVNLFNDLLLMKMKHFEEDETVGDEGQNEGDTTD